MKREVVPARPLEEARVLWRKHFGAPPPIRSTELLELMLTWRLQAAAQGGLSDSVRRAVSPRCVGRRSEGLEEGSRVVREWRGQRHEVEVAEEGFLYRGRTYDSLSMIARQITGVRRNGPKFFGMRNPAE